MIKINKTMDERELYRLWKCNIDITERIKQKIHANDILRKFNKGMI